MNYDDMSKEELIELVKSIGAGGVKGELMPGADHVSAKPVGWQFFDNGRWYNGDDRIKDHRANTVAAGYPVRDVFAAQPDHFEQSLDMVPAQTQQPVNGADRLPIELRGIAEAASNGGGFWRACSGCHESNEGMATGPFSETLKCHLGVGCSECGSIGAIWDTTDYDAMADFMAAQAQPDQSTPYESALTELIDKIIPGLDTGDILADARRASAALAQQNADSGMMDWLEEQARNSSTGISFDWVGRTAENNGSVTDGGWRFMRRKFLGERKLSIREAIQVAQKALE